MKTAISFCAAEVWRVFDIETKIAERRAFWSTNDETRALYIAERMVGVWVFDNEKYHDRYTIVIADEADESFDIYGASENPFAPGGVGQYSHTTDTSPLDDYRKFKAVGEEIKPKDFHKLPYNLRRFIIDRL